MTTLRQGRPNGLKKAMMFAAAFPLLQGAGCTLDSIRAAMVNGFAGSISNDAFSASQTFFANILGV